MGGSIWSDNEYLKRASHRKSVGSDGFDYHKTAVGISAMTGEKLKPHKTLDIKNVQLRESRDSKEHPESLAISCLLDVTGSMRKVPKLLQQKLNTLMALLIKKGYVEHPQIMYGAIGDAIFDDIPIQIGQFESGIEGEESLTNLVLEGGGGNGLAESHELSMYFLARHTVMDCLEKRDKKGYLFIITDEPAYKALNKEQVKEYIGDTLQADIPVADIVKELNQKFEVFILIPQDTANCNDKEMLEFWQDFYGQRVVKVPNPSEIAETIASLIGLNEGKIDIDDLTGDLNDLGVAKRTVDNVVTSVSTYAKSSYVVKRDKAKVMGELSLPNKKIKSIKA